LGPEQEFSVVNEELKAFPIVDKILKDFHGCVVNFVELFNFTAGKELQLHVIEIKPNAPFKSPKCFEETMQNAVLTLTDFLERKHNAFLLGTGVHPLLRLEETGISSLTKNCAHKLLFGILRVQDLVGRNLCRKGVTFLNCEFYDKSRSQSNIDAKSLIQNGTRVRIGKREAYGQL
jgi:hypothetical protein